MPTKKMIRFVQKLRLKGINISMTKPKSQVVLSITQNRKIQAPKL